ncbi:MAG: DUF2811 domain-containing protein [Xenococcaceae cyanobacterium MO_188.B19]|nr:DUF2811 domain-containing protein [Xenococcaceae cyanobacterium MO_188.B19]
MKSELLDIILSIELEENLYFCLKDFLDSHPDWNQQQVINTSLDSFLDHNQTIVNSEISQVITKAIQAQSVLE